MDTDELTVFINPPIDLKIAGFAPKCSGGNDGQAVVIPSGGSGNFTYIWTPTQANTASITASPGSYTVVVTDQFGCKDTATTVIPNPPPISGLTSVITSNCNKADGSAIVDSVWGGTPGYTFSWNTIPAQTTRKADHLVAGNYNVTITDANGCVATLTTIVPNTPGIKTNLKTTPVHCYGGNDGTASIEGMNGLAPYTFVWSNSQTSDSIGNLIAGIYTVITTDARGCPMKDTITILQPPPVDVISSDTNICPGASISLTARGTGGTGTLNYRWTPGLLTGSSILVSPSLTTTYTILAIDANGCSDSATVTLTVNKIPVINVSADTICFGQSTTLFASGANRYTWSPSTGLNSTSESTVTANPLTTITYTITGTDSHGCVGTTTTELMVIPSPTIITTGGNACPGDTIHLTASGAITYNWSPAGGLNTTSGAEVIATVNSSTTYTVTGKGNNGCTSNASATATINPVPEARIHASPNPASVFYPTIYFTDISFGNPVKWNWSFGDIKKTTSSLQHPSFTYPDSIKDYNVRLIISNVFGCVDTTNMIVVVKGEYSFYIPNTFTPNGDGINDGFAPKGTGIDLNNYDFWIFDRWGNQIFHTSSWGDYWNGKANDGEDVTQIDTYVWKVRVKERDTHIQHHYIGHVNIVK